MGYQLTKNEIIKEIVKSGKDPAYFINNYAKISHPMRGLIPFRTYDFQDDLLKNFNDYLPKEGHIFVNGKFMLSAYSFKWFVKKIKQIVKKENKDVRSIRFEQLLRDE